MAKLTYKQKDLNRFVKVYPYARFPPKYVLEYDQTPSGADMEAAKISFVDSDTEVYNLTGLYTSAPVVTISSVGSDQTNVSLTISSISTTTVTVSASSKFTGEVHIHIVAA